MRKASISLCNALKSAKISCPPEMPPILSASNIDDAADPRLALSILLRDCSPLGLREASADWASMLVLP